MSKNELKFLGKKTIFRQPLGNQCSTNTPIYLNALQYSAAFATKTEDY